ncbi:Uncharacterized protein dnl_62750 [Desulfonema limicola]|uniref:Uncharacterized protein n=1 Tax=Desulfonema limicola TaxID=45656 RepID=A0A975BEL9_9BACT|nr:Uncharacterized protein dnl_62750 [Desulfonema limicola]
MIGDTFFGLFYKPSPEEVAVRRIDMFLGRAENFNDSDESSQKTVEP